MKICNFEGFSIFSAHIWIIQIHPELAKLFKCKGFPSCSAANASVQGVRGVPSVFAKGEPWSGAVELLAGKVGSKWALLPTMPTNHSSVFASSACGILKSVQKYCNKSNFRDIFIKSGMQIPMYNVYNL